MALILMTADGSLSAKLDTKLDTKLDMPENKALRGVEGICGIRKYLRMWEKAVKFTIDNQG
jgi:hypothetical protein